ncbi:MAG: AHH domain-containing protein, partial [Phycicoccus sp.]
AVDLVATALEQFAQAVRPIVEDLRSLATQPQTPETTEQIGGLVRVLTAHETECADAIRGAIGPLGGGPEITLGEAAEIAVGIALIVGGGFGEAAGLGLDGTVVGAPAGVAVGAASTAGILYGRELVVAALARAVTRGAFARLSAPSSRVLGTNLERAGVIRPVESAAHHIVPGAHRQSTGSRTILERFGIDINDAGNGVFLPSSSTSLNPTGAAVHAKIHGTRYHQEVERLLSQARTPEEALETLAYIRSRLLAGGFP